MHCATRRGGGRLTYAQFPLEHDAIVFATLKRVIRGFDHPEQHFCRQLTDLEARLDDHR
jgi:hypothetical protein